MTPPPPSSDPLDRYPDVVAALASAVPAVAPPPRLKERLELRLREFARCREASFNLLSRSPDRLRDRVLCAPHRRRRSNGRPLARVVVSRCGKEVAFFCWDLPPLERFALVFERADGASVPCAVFDTDGAGAGEIPYLTLPPGAALASVSLRRIPSGETVLSAKL